MEGGNTSHAYDDISDSSIAGSPALLQLDTRPEDNGSRHHYTA